MSARAHWRSVALHRINHRARKLCSKTIVIGPRKVRPQILVWLTCREIPPQQPLNRIRNIIRSRPIPQRSRRPCKLAHRATHAEVERIDRLPILLDLLPLKPNVRNPVLPALVRASRHMQLDLLVEPRQPLLHLAHQPLRKALRLRRSPACRTPSPCTQSPRARTPKHPPATRCCSAQSPDPPSSHSAHSPR